MATKHQLRNRWKSDEGARRAGLVMEALQRGATRDELSRLVAGLPFAEEVAPALDLRGIEFGLGLSLENMDLSGSRLDGASLDGDILGCRLAGAVLDGLKAINSAFEGDFTGASLVGASLKGVRFLRCDLSGADLTGAPLGGVRFDERTRLAGADLTGAAMDDDLRAYAESAGANLGAAAGAYELAEFDAAFKVLRRRNRGGRLDAVLARMSELRPELERDASFDWGTRLAGEFPPEVMSEVADAVQEGGSNLPYYG